MAAAVAAGGGRRDGLAPALGGLGHDLVELVHGAVDDRCDRLARIEGLVGERDTYLDLPGTACDHEGGGRIEDRHVAKGSDPALEHAGERLGVRLRITAA